MPRSIDARWCAPVMTAIIIVDLGLKTQPESDWS